MASIILVKIKLNVLILIKFIISFLSYGYHIQKTPGHGVLGARSLPLPQSLQQPRSLEPLLSHWIRSCIRKKKGHSGAFWPHNSTTAATPMAYGYTLIIREQRVAWITMTFTIYIYIFFKLHKVILYSHLFKKKGKMHSIFVYIRGFLI